MIERSWEKIDESVVCETKSPPKWKEGRKEGRNTRAFYIGEITWINSVESAEVLFTDKTRERRNGALGAHPPFLYAGTMTPTSFSWGSHYYRRRRTNLSRLPRKNLVNDPERGPRFSIYIYIYKGKSRMNGIISSSGIRTSLRMIIINKYLERRTTVYTLPRISHRM